jgi:hypothetical protein
MHSKPFPPSPQGAPVNLTRPANPLRWHEVLHQSPEIARRLQQGYNPPTPHRLAKAWRQCFGQPPYGGWPGQRFLYEAAMVPALAQWLEQQQPRTSFRRGAAALNKSLNRGEAAQ